MTRHRTRGRYRGAMTRGRLVVHAHFYQPSRVDPVHRCPATRARGCPVPRLERADHRRVLPPRRRARLAGARLVGPRTDPQPLPRGRGTRRARRLRRGRPPRRRHGPRPGNRPGLPPRDPAVRPAARPADGDPLGPARLRGPLRSPGHGDLVPRDGHRPGDAAGRRRGGHHRHAPGAVAGGCAAPRPARLPRGPRRRAPHRRGVLRRRPVRGGLVRALAHLGRGPLRPRADRPPAPRGPPGRHRAHDRDRQRRRALRPPPAVPRPVPACPGGPRRRRAGPRLRRRHPRRRCWPSDPARPHPEIRIRERTSWSCHHGVLRWGGECPDVPDGRWKAPLRGALDRLAGAIDTIAESIGGRS